MWQNDGIPLDILYLKLHLLCAGPLYLPVKWQWSLTLQCFLSLAHLSSITKFFCKFNWFLSFHMIRALFVLIISFSYLSKLIISIEYPSKDLQNFFMKSLPLYISFLVFIQSNAYIVEIENPDCICSPTFVVDIFRDYFYIHFFFNLRFKIFINSSRCLISFIVLMILIMVLLIS